MRRAGVNREPLEKIESARAESATTRLLTKVGGHKRRVLPCNACARLRRVGTFKSATLSVRLTAAVSSVPHITDIVSALWPNPGVPRIWRVEA